MTNICHDKHNVVATILLLSQKHAFCCDKYVFVATKICLSRQNFCHDKHLFVVTNIILSWQNICCDKHIFVMTKDVFCHDKHTSVGTKLLSRQKWYLWQLPPMTGGRWRGQGGGGGRGEQGSHWPSSCPGRWPGPAWWVPAGCADRAAWCSPWWLDCACASPSGTAASLNKTHHKYMSHHKYRSTSPSGTVASLNKTHHKYMLHHKYRSTSPSGTVASLSKTHSKYMSHHKYMSISKTLGAGWNYSTFWTNSHTQI